jgi:small subunit ribosomal protein S2
LEKNLGSINDMTRLPGALFVVDIKREQIAIKEAQKLKIPIFAMVDTNSDPREVDFVIPANDDATKSIGKIMSLMVDAVQEGLQERKNEKESQEQAQSEEAAETEKTEAAAEETVTEKIEEAPAVEEAKEEAPAMEDKTAQAEATDANPDSEKE